MVGTGRAREVLLVAAIASGRCTRVIVVCVALSARHTCVRSRQRIIRIDRVIKARSRPVGGRVTSAAVMGKSKLHMRGIITARKICRVARIAISRRSREHIVDMACRTWKRRMHPGQRITREFQVIEFGVEPAVHGVATFARGRKAESHVIDCLGCKVLLMAGIASGR